MTYGASRLHERNPALADYNGGLSIIDIERCTSASPGTKNPVEIFTVNDAHDGLINDIDGIGGTSIGHGAPEIVTAGKDGRVRVWDPRTKDPVACMKPEVGASSRDCWSVAFGNSYNDDERCVCAGYDNGDIKLFDLRTNSLRWETTCRNGVTNVQFDRIDIEMNKLLATTLESKFLCYDMRTHHPKEGYAHLEEKAHRSTVW
eukprot:CAMPEP_0184873964 /NCGR_PEP_ID=MMETSP0580-20130426/42129_1 /TAXON_ID=1118495 /ORGANISM="Dactyliosolen fragilissimus" /LENGTH=202 /DNA_ID=CAMNT_0027376919 /DNA_START=277 /DNA_END=882 /DNA_ORIENTATION=-